MYVSPCSYVIFLVLMMSTLGTQTTAGGMVYNCLQHALQHAKLSVLGNQSLVISLLSIKNLSP